MANIQHISKHMVQAFGQKNVQNQRIHLTPWDLRYLSIGPILRGLLFHKPNSLTKTSLIHNLKHSLSRTLDFYPALSGRLSPVKHEDNTTSFYIDCNNKGALFIHAVADQIKVSDIIQCDKTIVDIDSFFPLNGVKNIEGDINPLLGVQVTELEDGIFIACTMNHSVGDGTSFWHFLNSWSEISRGSDISSSKVPNFQRSFLNDYHINFPIRIPNSKLEQIQNDSISSCVSSKIFHFTKENISKIKSKANVEAGTNQISSLQALTCHIWTSICRAKNLNPNLETTHQILIGARPRVKFLPQNYFGNALQLGHMTLKAGELLEKGFGNAALSLNTLISAHTEEKLVELLVLYSKSPYLITRVGAFEGVLVIGSHRFDIYGNDFGWGRPIMVRGGEGNRFNGLLVVSPGVGEGSIDIEVCLLDETLDALVRDLDFMGVVTI